ncbi:MAG TPA: DUF1778 domain-containing protein [Polyangiaceae bacterium]|nr:DUF1778 domain-containing protein [Polyangiaceae bacterium]
MASIAKKQARPRKKARLSVSAKAHAEFVARLDAPAKPNERLRRTTRAALPWK